MERLTNDNSRERAITRLDNWLNNLFRQNYTSSLARSLHDEIEITSFLSGDEFPDTSILRRKLSPEYIIASSRSYFRDLETFFRYDKEYLFSDRFDEDERREFLEPRIQVVRKYEELVSSVMKAQNESSGELTDRDVSGIVLRVFGGKQGLIDFHLAAADAALLEKKHMVLSGIRTQDSYEATARNVEAYQLIFPRVADILLPSN